MRFFYEYRSRDNVRHSGVIDARDKDDAVCRLRKKGIKPCRITIAPGFFNKLFGCYKRWIAICLMGLAILIMAIFFLLEKCSYLYGEEDRAQIFGDPSLLQKLSYGGWSSVFTDEVDSWLARHAIPGHVCDCSNGVEQSRPIAVKLFNSRRNRVPIYKCDFEEVKKIKRIVNGMRSELSNYADSIEETIDYMKRACERTRIEKGIYDNVRNEMERLRKILDNEGSNRQNLLQKWDEKNEMLRSMGLRTIPLPEE